MRAEKIDPRQTGGFTAGVIRYYRISILAVAALLTLGVWAFHSLPRSEDPEFDIFDCRVLTLFPGADPDTVESLLTRPIEDAVSEVAGIGTIESRSVAGLSLTLLSVRHDASPVEVLEEVRTKVEDLESELPRGAEEPVVSGFNTGDIPVIIASLAAPMRYPALEREAERLEQALDRLAEVKSVEIEGMPERQILVDVHGERLAQLRVPLTRIAEVLGLENAAVPGGTLDIGARRFVLENPNEYTRIEQIEETVIGAAGESLIFLRDVATVTDGFEDGGYRVRTNGEKALLLTVVKRRGANTVAVAREVRHTLEAAARTLPEGLELRIISDRGASVSGLLGNLWQNAIGGGVLVVLMVGWFLGVRQGLVVSVSIPLSVAIALILLRTSGIGLNQVSIFGLVLALGMLVDSSLVVVENIGRHLDSDKPLIEAVRGGVDEVRTPVLASALTTIAAFVPMLFLTGNLGTFIFDLPMAVIFAISGSLVVALTTIPLLCYTLWHSFPPPREAVEKGSKVLDLYTELAKAALRHRGLTFGLACLVFAASLATIPLLGFQLFPKAEKSFFLVNVRLPREANLATTDLVSTQVEDILAAEADVRDFTTNLGKGSPMIYYNLERQQQRPSFAQILVNLRPGVAAESYAPRLRPKLRQIAGASVEPRILEQGPVGGAAIQVRVLGDSVESLAALAGEIRGRMDRVDGIVDLRDTLGEKIPRLVLELDRRKAAVLGVDSFSFSRTVFMAANGQEATRFRDHGAEVPVIVRLERSALREVSSVANLYLPSAGGEAVPFSEIAVARPAEGFAQIDRRDGRRCVTVSADVAGRLADEALHEVRAALADLELPAGYRIEYGGEQEKRDESFAGLGGALLLALLLIYALLAIQFNSFIQPVVILLTVPFGVTGALFGLLLTGNPFGFMAFIGIVSLTGIIINDSIVLVDFANYLQRVEGKRLLQAILEAGRMRLRPVTLTSITTIGGLTPLAIWGGSLWSPLACSIIFGLVGATVLILIVLPVVYSLLVGAREGRRAQRLLVAVGRRFLGRDEARAIR